jgi:hypothetical protein
MRSLRSEDSPCTRDNKMSGETVLSVLKCWQHHIAVSMMGFWTYPSWVKRMGRCLFSCVQWQISSLWQIHPSNFHVLTSSGRKQIEFLKYFDLSGSAQPRLCDLVVTNCHHHLINIKMDVCVCMFEHNSGTPGAILTKLGTHIAICMCTNLMYILYIFRREDGVGGRDLDDSHCWGNQIIAVAR